jgi:magnesium transporter
MIVDCAVYTKGERRPGQLALEVALEAGREPDSFVWIGLHEPTAEEFASVQHEFNLHVLAVEDALRGHQRPKIELYEDCVFVVVKTARYIDSSETVEFAEIQVFVGEGFVVTVRHGAASALTEVRRNLEGRADLLSHGPAAVLHAVIDHVVDDYAPVVAGLDNDISEVEGDVFGERTVGDDPTQRVYQLKKEALDFYRAAKPLGDAVARLVHGQVPYCNLELTDYFRDVGDHLRSVIDEAEDFREQLADILNANLAQVALRQNDDQRKMSAWLAIGAFPTVLGAIYGMNFTHMPELEHRLGYPVVLATMVVVCLWLYFRFKRAKWL